MEKNFDPILSDYVFFEMHSTEAEEDVRIYFSHLKKLNFQESPIRMLDFGCGAGRFTGLLLDHLNWPKGDLRIALVEPGEEGRRMAVERLDKYCRDSIRHWPALPADADLRFDVVVSNHVFYYVPDLSEAVQAILNSLASTGIFLAALAGEENVLIQFWEKGFGLMGKPIPYHTAEDFERVLEQLEVPHQKSRNFYELVFSDSRENRLKILRFLFSDHLEEMPVEELLAFFDPYVRGEEVCIETMNEYFSIQ